MSKGTQGLKGESKEAAAAGRKGDGELGAWGLGEEEEQEQEEEASFI